MSDRDGETAIAREPYHASVSSGPQCIFHREKSIRDFRGSLFTWFSYFRYRFERDSYRHAPVMVLPLATSCTSDPS